MKPCQHRKVVEDGRIICEKIVEGDNEVGPTICRSCPAMKINCTHLKFTLVKVEGREIVVRYGNGRSEVWPAEPARVHFYRGACAARVMPVEGPRTCVGCALHQPACVPDAARPPVSVPAAVSDGSRVLRFPHQRAIAS